MKDAMLLPLNPDTQSPLLAAVCFASRSQERYDPAAGRLLGNIAQLLALSFTRTARLADQAHLAALGELASGIAHELRSPLGTISLALDHIGSQQFGDRSRRRLELAARACEQMGRLLEDLLLYAKPVRLELLPVDLGVMLTEHVAERRELSPATGLEVEIRVRDAWITGDKRRLRQVLSNLTDNAVQAAEPGSSVLWTLTQADTNDSLRIAIRNRGAVIPPELLARLPRPFYSTKPDGTGLGLAIAQRLVERHGGRLTIRSERGLDTEVEVTLPSATRPGDDERPASSGA
jgi:signal transduction histidine kinase